jgi:glycosyltransferase involved in cell wall biosynthesis
VRIAALLPHIQVFGGVRRYLELGTQFVRHGHEFTLFHPAGGPPDWLPFAGRTLPFSAIGNESFDIGLCSEYSVLDRFSLLPASRKYFYFVLEGHKREREVARSGLRLLANSEGLARRIERKYGAACLRAPGGINPDLFHPLPAASPRDTFNVLCYGRIYKRRKGIRHILSALDGLAGRTPNLRLILFDSLVGDDRRDPRPMIRTRVPFEFHLDLPQDRMAWLFGQADLFVSAELRAGWSNTTAEAMACRVPVVCTPSGTRDFAFDGRTALVAPFPAPFLLRRRIRRMIENPGLRRRLAEAGYEKIGDFAWSALAEKLLGLFAETLGRGD